MKLVVNLKLKPSPEQARSLRETLERCNAACDWLSERAFATRTFRQFSIHKASYFDCKSRFSLTAQAVVRCIAKVSDSYKIDSKSQRYFRKHSAQPYDDRIFRFASEDSINIWTVNKRQTISFECGEYQRKMLPFRKGEVDLMFVRNNWYIAVVCDIDEPDIIDCTDILGIDLGVVNIATDSDGTVYSGSTIEHNRRIQSHRRRNLHRKRTRAATRKLNILRGIQARFQKHTNHCISKAIVADAIATERAIAIEDLSGIRSRVKAKRRQRARLHNWSFSQLRQFLKYKALGAGIPLILVNPRYTSQICPECGTVDRRNRPHRDYFVCISCGFSGQADNVAAINIRQRALTARAAVNPLEGISPRVDEGLQHAV